MPETYDEVLQFEGVGEKIALLYMLVAMKQVNLIHMEVSGYCCRRERNEG